LDPSKSSICHSAFSLRLREILPTISPQRLSTLPTRHRGPQARCRGRTCRHTGRFGCGNKGAAWPNRRKITADRRLCRGKQHAEKGGPRPPFLFTVTRSLKLSCVRAAQPHMFCCRARYTDTRAAPEIPDRP